MRFILILILSLLSYSVYSQYPEQDHHTSVGGAGEWYNQSGHANMGVEGGTVLCYNIATSYVNGQQYIWESSDYGTQFVDDGLDSVYFAVNLTLDIRSNGDLFYMGYFDGGVWKDFLIPYRQVGVWTTFYVWAPKTTTKFRYRLSTGGSGNTNGKFVHIDWTSLDTPSNILPIELVEWSGKLYDDIIVLHWTTASEINNDRFEIYWSVDAENWKLIGTKQGAGNSSIFIDYYHKHTSEQETNYYKLRQIDFDGRYEDFHIIVVSITNDNIREKDYIYINPLGQQVTKDYRGLKYKKYLK